MCITHRFGVLQLLQNVPTEYGWNVMAHVDARVGKWMGNWRMQWVASTLHTTSKHGLSSITTADAHTSAASSRLNWRPPADLNGLVRFALKDEIWFLRVCHQFQLASTCYLGRLQLKCDGTRWRKRGEVKGKLANAVGSQYPSHYLGTWFIQHYYRWRRTPRLPVVDWTDPLTRADLNGLVRFARKTKSGFCACDVTF